MAEELKRRAAAAALVHVGDGMRLGLGSGTTMAHFVELLGERVAAGLNVVGVPTSERTAALARTAGIPTATLDEHPELDLAIDGADEVGPRLALIKGAGGALLREKIVAYASARLIVIADAGKRVAVLGAFPLPIEVSAFGIAATALAIGRAAAELELNPALALRQSGGAPFVTDGGNHILDASFGRISEPERLAERLSRIPGVLEHGLFLGMADLAILASPAGVEEVEV